MKRLLKKIADMLADAALLEMGANVLTAAEHHSTAIDGQRINLPTRIFDTVTGALADDAMLEMGVNTATPSVKRKAVRETLEENLIEVAFAEAADYDDIHQAILREHNAERDIAHPDDCQYGDNDLCFV